MPSFPITVIIKSRMGLYIFFWLSRNIGLWIQRISDSKLYRNYRTVGYWMLKKSSLAQLFQNTVLQCPKLTCPINSQGLSQMQPNTCHEDLVNLDGEGLRICWQIGTCHDLPLCLKCSRQLFLIRDESLKNTLKQSDCCFSPCR